MVGIVGHMHWRMDFIAAVGTLAAGCGLKEIIQTTFGSVDKMLTGEKYPQNARALRLTVEEVLRPVLKDETYDINNMDQLELELEKRAKLSKTTRLWVDIIIRPVFLLLLHERASHESDFLLHI